MSKGEQDVRKRGQDEDRKRELVDLEPIGTDKVVAGETGQKEMLAKA